MATRLSGAALSAALGSLLGGTVADLRRLSGGASRVTSAFELVAPGTPTRALILQMERGGAGGASSGKVQMERALLDAARRTQVPVPAVVAMGMGGELGADWLVVERLDGETIPRKLLRDAEWDEPRRALTTQCAAALAAIHTIDPDQIAGLPPADPLGNPVPYLDRLGEVRPALELGARWLANHRHPAGPAVTVHGDYRMGNLLVGPDGLRAVLDWEMAHAGDPAEDLGWLCAPAWRFGGSGEVGGFGALDELLEAYAAGGGGTVERARVHWWQVYATVKWGVICALQASAHLSGSTRSVELAAIGRRICESEWDLCTLLGVEPTGPVPVPATRSSATVPFGRPTAAELIEAVREHLETVVEHSADGGRFEFLVARNVLAIAERELLYGPAIAAAHARRLRDIGVSEDTTLVAAIRAGDFDEGWEPVASALAATARDQLLVANPSYLSGASA